MTGPLNSRQRAFLEWLWADPARENMPLARMAEGFGIRAKSGIHYLLNQLEALGYVRRLRRRGRCLPCSLELLAPPPALPANFGLRIVAGPHHWRRRAAEKRRAWAIAEGGTEIAA